MVICISEGKIVQHLQTKEQQLSREKPGGLKMLASSLSNFLSIAIVPLLSKANQEPNDQHRLV